MPIAKQFLRSRFKLRLRIEQTADFDIEIERF